MALPTPRAFYAGVFLVSGLLMCLQVIQSRIFSVTTWYHLSFLIISMAMFGLTLGALKVHKGDAAEQRKKFGVQMGDATVRFSFAVLVALAAQMQIPVVSDQPGMTLILLPLMSLLTVPPYYYAGIALSLAITRAPFPAARTYGVDLLGAAAGCLLALGLMETIDAPSAILGISVAGFLAARCFAPQVKWQSRLAAIAAGLLLALNVTAAKHVIYPLWVKGHYLTQDVLELDRWNSISRVTIQPERKKETPYLWGPSAKLPQSVKTDWRQLHIDGNAGTVISRWRGDRGRELHFLDYDVTNIAYALPGLKKSGIIGLGGGRDVLSSLHAGITDITALDVNAVQVDVLSKIEPYKSYANLHNVPGLRLIHNEARSWLSQNPDTFDLIQMSLVDTWASTGAGAFALSENGLYTVDAWKTFLSRLNKGGVLTVSRWFVADAEVEGERLLSLTMAALFGEGAKEPRKHIFAATSRSIITLVMSRDPFAAPQLDAMEKRVKEMGFDILASPRKTLPAGREFAKVLAVKSRAELDALADKSHADIRPPVDSRPFFFSQVRVTQPLEVLKLVFGKDGSATPGSAQAIANLYIIILFAAMMVCFTIIYPLGRALKARQTAFLKAGTAWFTLIGLGFMLMEIALLQRMSVYLGHPAYGLSVVLFSLVLSTGCGSLLSDKFPLRTPSARAIWALGTACVAALGMGLLGCMMGLFADAALPMRALVCAAITLPLGCLLGFGFPTGMALAKKLNPDAAAWFWGINGAAGVMASGLAIAFNLAWGLETTMCLGALCYGALAVVGWKSGRAG